MRDMNLLQFLNYITLQRNRLDLSEYNDLNKRLALKVQIKSLDYKQCLILFKVSGAVRINASDKGRRRETREMLASLLGKKIKS